MYVLVLKNINRVFFYKTREDAFKAINICLSADKCVSCGLDLNEDYKLVESPNGWVIFNGEEAGTSVFKLSSLPIRQRLTYWKMYIKSFF